MFLDFSELLQDAEVTELLPAQRSGRDLARLESGRQTGHFLGKVFSVNLT
jgi:hypothetical protein